MTTGNGPRVLHPVATDGTWDWGRDVRAGMLFAIDGGYLRVRSLRGEPGRKSPELPDRDDVLKLCRAVGAGQRVCIVADDPATAGCLMAGRGHEKAP